MSRKLSPACEALKIHGVRTDSKECCTLHTHTPGCLSELYSEWDSVGAGGPESEKRSDLPRNEMLVL